MVLAWWLAHHGDVEAAFAAVWRAYVELDYFVVSWLWFPVFSQVREHDRFPELLERVGLMDYWRAKSGAPAPVTQAVPTTWADGAQLAPL